MSSMNIHGEWTQTFEKRVLHTKVTGSTNSEAVENWLEEAIKLVESSDTGTTKPWAVFNDARDWAMGSQDSWDASNTMVHVLEENNCRLFAVVFSKQIQKFAIENGFVNQGMVQLFTDYDEAYQACLEAVKTD